MIQDVRYKGYSVKPSDYEVEDGELAMGMGMVVEDGVIKPLEQPKELFELEEGQEVIYIHAAATYKHYIVRDGDGWLYWVNNIEGGVASLTQVHKFTEGVINVNSTGNTLIVLSGDGVHYLLWQPDRSSYLYLGQKPEMLDLSFGLSENKISKYQNNNYGAYDFYIPGTPVPKVEQANFVYSYVGDGEGRWDNYLTLNQNRDRLTIKQSKIDPINDAIMAAVNKGNAEVAKQGHFYAPFYVRYCYRLYDDNMWMHSAPVYMPVSMPYANTSILTNFKVVNGELVYAYAGGTYDLVFYTFIRNVALTCKALCDASFINNLKSRWGDIIKSVDIFVSLPLVREDTSEKMESFSVVGNGTRYNLENANLAIQNQTRIVKYDNDSTDSIYDYECALADVPLISEEAYMDKIRNVGAFYKVKSIDLDNFDIPTTHYGEIEINKDVLPILATQEQMDDDYKSHNLLLPLSDEDGNVVTSMFSYNSRENIAAVKEKLFNGFPVSMLTPYCTNDPSSLLLGNYDVHNIYVMLSTEEGKKVVQLNYVRPDKVTPMILYNCPLFYPDSRATGMIIDVEINQSMRTLYLSMKEHAFLNGAITNGGIMSSIGTHFDTYGESVVVNDKISYPNKIYTSEVNNPFIFKATGVNTIGTGLIRGMASATKALSEGQFGQFPLYSFTTDGVWALTVADTGVFTSANPVSRDVCISAESITPLDTSVLFATERGIMRIVGSETVCISDKIDDEQAFDVMTLPEASTLLTGNYAVVTPVSFRTFLQDCRMAYDYRHQRVYLFNPQVENYAYIYSLPSRQWTIVKANLSSAVNSYPDALVMTDDNKLVNLSERAIDTAAEICHGVLVTRPLKLGAGDILKTVKTVVQLGYFQRGEVKTVLYGSRDLFHWQLIASSRDNYIRGLHGTPYKFFRVMSLVTMDRGRNLSGVRFEYEQKFKNVLH